MTSTWFYFYNLLNQKRTGWLIIAIATASKSILTAIFSSYETDKSYYLLLAKNIWAGEGFTIPVTLLNNPGITENIYLPSALSPLYSLIAAPLLSLFPGDYILVSWLIESLSWLFLFIVLRKLFFRVTKDHFWSNLFILFCGFFLYNVEFNSPAKDVLAIAFLFAGLLRCLFIGEPAKRRSFSWLAVTALLFLLPGLVRLTYMPFAIIFPLLLLFIGFLKKERSIIRSGFITLGLSAILLAAYYFYFHSLENEALTRYADFYANRWSLAQGGNEFIAGFFPENLKRMYPFIPASIVNLDIFGVQVKTHLFPAYRAYAILLFTAHFTGLAVFVAAFFYLIKRFYRSFVPERIFFLLAGMFISISVVALLSFMSLRYQAVGYKGSASSWTYVYENRSFLFPILFLQVCLFVFLFAKKQTAGFLYWLRMILLIIVAVSFLHGVYFVVKKITQFPNREQKGISVNKLVTHASDSIRKANPGYAVWIATEMAHLDWFAKLHHQKVLNNVAYLNDSNFRLPSKTILLTAIRKEDTAKISSYLRRTDVKQIRNYDDAYFVFRQETQ